MKNSLSEKLHICLQNIKATLYVDIIILHTNSIIIHIIIEILPEKKDWWSSLHVFEVWEMLDNTGIYNSQKFDCSVEKHCVF